MSNEKHASESPTSPSRCYLWLRSWFSWSAWYRWMHDFKDCEIDAQTKGFDKRRFLVVADSREGALMALIVPRLNDKYPGRCEVCVALRAEVWLPDFCWLVTATYR